MTYYKKIVFCGLFLVCRLSLFGGTELWSHWMNTTLRNDIINGQLKSFNHYLFWGIVFDKNKSEWFCIYELDYKPVKIESNGGLQFLDAAFTETMYDQEKRPLTSLPIVQMIFSSDTSSITLVVDKVDTILFSRVNSIEIEPPYEFRYYIESVISGHYKDQYANKSLLVSSDSIQLGEALYKYEILASNICYIIENHRRLDSCELYYARIRANGEDITFLISTDGSSLMLDTKDEAVGIWTRYSLLKPSD